VELEHPAVPGVGVEDEFGVEESSMVFLEGTILSLAPFITSVGWWMLARSAGCCRPHRWMALSWARNAPTEMALSRSFVRSSRRARNSFAAPRPFGVLVKNRNSSGSRRVSSPRTVSW